MERCGWAGPDQIYLDYHDTDWGVPEYDSRALWEKLVLDGFQAGLSWITILKKRENFRTAFAGFQPVVIAQWGTQDVARLLGDTGIIRHRGKIEATISNARVWQEIEAHEGFNQFLWKYVDGVPVQNRWRSLSEVPAFTPLSTQISKDLKKAGFRFCGPTIVYAFMQAVGMVNDHLVTCHRHDAVAKMAAEGRYDSAFWRSISAASLVLVAPARDSLSGEIQRTTPFIAREGPLEGDQP